MLKLSNLLTLFKFKKKNKVQEAKGIDLKDYEEMGYQLMKHPCLKEIRGKNEKTK